MAKILGHFDYKAQLITNQGGHNFAPGICSKPGKTVSIGSNEKNSTFSDPFVQIRPLEKKSVKTIK